jgi:hypothetical protein
MLHREMQEAGSSNTVETKAPYPAFQRRSGTRNRVMCGKSIVRAGALLSVLAATAMATVSPAAAGMTFPVAVEKILMSQSSGPVSKLPADRKRELIACVNQVLADLPNGKKRFVTEAANYSELENRFGTVVMENRAEWKQRIARSCAHIAV